MPTESGPSCPITYPGFVFRTLRQDGHHAEALLAGTGLTAEAFDDGKARIEYQVLGRLMHNAVALTGDPHLSLRLAQRFDAQYIGLPAFAAMSAPSFVEGLRVMQRFFSLIFSAIEFTLPEEDAPQCRDEVAICLRSTAALENAGFGANISALIGSANLLNRMLRTHSVVCRAETRARQPDGWETIAIDIGFPISFECNEDRLFFPQALLSQPLPGADPINHPHLLALCEDLVTSIGSDETPAKRVLRFLEEGDNLSRSLGETAAALGYSERGLRRQLEMAGTSFRRLVDEIRQRRAQELLGRSSHPISLIAQDLVRYAIEFLPELQEMDRHDPSRVPRRGCPPKNGGQK
ncbi:Transcriptional Regulator, AraC family protein [Parvularcula bermudensis HTCC2503]|uniref:Transcriptional Regulator, AraC family protein n=1 Tax=Parvularcula bermudensis (strain ATCC BAA-594 / HTCC2503 / KCTC 12087) TaxID=314260 RepID=E0TDG6_PARBH|nr:Transcriptional Regulator, AraC family protein [Parvularcula bermudensis HTCC2503]